MPKPKSQPHPSKSKKRSQILKAIVAGVALIALMIGCIITGPYLGFSLIASALTGVGITITLLIGGLALDAARPASRKITPSFLKKLSQQSDEKKEKSIADLDNTLGIQWIHNPALFKKNFTILKKFPDIIKAIGSSMTSHQGVATEGNELITLLINSDDQTKALPFVMEIINKSIKDIDNQDEIDRIILRLIYSSVITHNKPLVQALISKWPNTNLNDTHFQKNSTLLLILIEENVPVENIKILLELKNKEGKALVNLDCLAGGKMNTTALELALKQNPSNVDLAILLKQYGATNYGSLSTKEIEAFEAKFKAESIAPPHTPARTKKATVQSIEQPSSSKSKKNKSKDNKDNKSKKPKKS